MFVAPGTYRNKEIVKHNETIFETACVTGANREEGTNALSFFSSSMPHVEARTPGY